MSEKIDTKNHPTVKALIEHRDRLDISDTVFARRHLGIAPATWSLLMSGTYPVQDPTPMLDRCADALQVLTDAAEHAETAADKDERIVGLTHVRAAIAAIKGCHKSAQNRLVLFLAPSGGGKTTLNRKLRDTYRSQLVSVEATETWRGSYFNAAADVAEALGITETFTNPRAVEAAVFDELNQSPRIVYIDEGHYCGPQALNFLKAILNKTPARVVLASIPQLWARLEEKAFEEAKQLRRRTHAKIVVASVEASDCRAFIEVKLPGYSGLKKDDEVAVVAAMASAANKFGLYDTLERICKEVELEAKGRPATVELVEAAIKRVEALRS